MVLDVLHLSFEVAGLLGCRVLRFLVLPVVGVGLPGAGCFGLDGFGESK